MKTDTLRKLAEANAELIELINHELEQAARPDAANICRLGDEAIAQYQATSAAITALLGRFPEIRENI